MGVTGCSDGDETRAPSKLMMISFLLLSIGRAEADLESEYQSIRVQYSI